MAKQISKPTSKLKYPWDKWTNGKWWRVKAGEDFDCTVPGFRNNLYQEAARRQLSVSTQVHHDEVEFCFSEA